MTWQSVIERTVQGLGYDLVDTERTVGGLLRVYIDRLPAGTYPSGPGEFVTVEDCELVTRQLQYVLEVDAVDYARLEVSSPGLDRALRRPADFERFAGNDVEVALRLPFQGRRKWIGRLLVRQDGGWFRGAGIAPDLPLDTGVLSEAELCAYASALARNGFFGAGFLVHEPCRQRWLCDAGGEWGLSGHARVVPGWAA